MPADRLHHLPDGADPMQAVGLAHMAATAYLGLFRRAGIRLGERIYIGGGAGNVGADAVRFAVDAGVRVRDAARVINRYLVAGTLEARIADVLPLARAAEAHSRMEHGELSGRRLILKPST